MPAKSRFVLALTILTAAVSSSAGEEQWKSLPLIQNGDLAPAWKHIGFGEFTVVDGTLRTDNDPRGLGLLYYGKRQFGDCQIRVVYRTENPSSNSGLYIRIADGLPDAPKLDPVKRAADGSLPPDQAKIMKNASEQEQGPWYAVHHGYEVQICDQTDPAHRTGSIYSLTTAKEFPKSDDGWNTMVVTLEGTRIKVAINGKTVSTFNSASSKIPPRKIWHEPKREPARPKSGYIGLQNHDPGDVVFFKEVSVRPLSK